MTTDPLLITKFAFSESDEDIYAEKDYRRERDTKTRVEEEEDEEENQKSPRKLVNKGHIQRAVVNDRTQNKQGPPPPQTFRFNKTSGQQQSTPYQPFPQQPDSQTKHGHPQSGKMPQPGIPSMPTGMPPGMPTGNQPMMPYPYPYPDYRYFLTFSSFV